MSSQGQRPCVIFHLFGPGPQAGLCPQKAVCVTNGIMTEWLSGWVVQGLAGMCSNQPDSNIWWVGEQSWLILRLCCGVGGRVSMSDSVHPHQSCVLHNVLAQPVPAKMGWLKTHSTANILRECKHLPRLATSSLAQDSWSLLDQLQHKGQIPRAQIFRFKDLEVH